MKRQSCRRKSSVLKVHQRNFGNYTREKVYFEFLLSYEPVLRSKYQQYQPAISISISTSAEVNIIGNFNIDIPLH